MRDVAARHRTTLSTVVLSAFFALLRRLTASDDLSVAVSVANRATAETQTMAGFFVNALVIRERVCADQSVDELVEKLSDDLRRALEYQAYPFDALVQRLAPARRGNQQPLFNVNYAFQSFGDLGLARSAAALDGMQDVSFAAPTAKFELSLFVVDRAGAGDGMQLGMEYMTELFRPATVVRMLRALQRMCAAIAGVAR